MTPTASKALQYPLGDSSRVAAQAVTVRLPYRPTLGEAGVDRDDKLAPGVTVDDFHRGDSSTFRTVLQHFGQLIMSIAAPYTHNHHDRQELYQEICVRLWKHRARYSGRGPLAAWINRIAHNHCKDWHRSRTSRAAAAERHAADTLALDEARTRLEDPSKLVANKEFMVRLRDALAQLPARQQETFTLVHVEGRDIAETALALGVSRATVHSNLRHAAQKLRQLMKNYIP